MAAVLVILGFLCWWPIGLLALGFLIARKKYAYAHGGMSCSRGAMFDGSLPMARWERKMQRAQEKVERVRSRMERFMGGGGFGSASSGNSAFDDYRAQTLKRLEDEQHEFKDFLERLRFAKDRAEFDEFMTERRKAAAAEAAPRSEPPAPEASH